MTDSTLNRFDQAVIQCQEPFRKAIIEVMDTAYMVKLWFEIYAPAALPADIVAMTAMVLEREKSAAEK